MHTTSTPTVTLRSVPRNLCRSAPPSGELTDRAKRASSMLGDILAGVRLPLSVRAQLAAAQYEIEAGLLDGDAR